MDAHTFAAIVIHRHKDGSVTILNGHCTGQVSAPHNIGLVRDNRTIMGLGTVWMSCPLGRLQAVLSHESSNTLLQGADALKSQPDPDLTVALAMKGTLNQDSPDMFEQLLVCVGPSRSTLTR